MAENRFRPAHPNLILMATVQETFLCLARAWSHLSEALLFQEGLCNRPHLNHHSHLVASRVFWHRDATNPEYPLCLSSRDLWTYFFDSNGSLFQNQPDLDLNFWA